MLEQRPLGRTGLRVSPYCLGTMTYSTTTSEAVAHAQMDAALAAGINFIDTAEMYPVHPATAENMGGSEEVVGRWFARHGRRDEWVLATKHSGAGMERARGGAPISAETISEAIDGSLKRLGLDYIDLYQFHWPNRGSYMFRQNWSYDPSAQNRVETVQNMADCLGALQREVDRGRIRAFGLSNESAWGTAQWLRLAEEGQGPRVASIQNEYSLMCRLYDTDLAELSMNEDVGLMAFSPLAAGLLSGQYSGGAVPAGSRATHADDLGGRLTPRALVAADAYVALAQKHGLDPVHMANAWVIQRPFTVSSIFGARTMAQMDHILAGLELTLSDELMAEIDALHKEHPMPF